MPILLATHRLAVAAGCGADAAPYFRIFNPITQGEKFDAREYKAVDSIA